MRFASRLLLVVASLGSLAAAAGAQAPAKRPIRSTDLYRIRTVGDPQRSPDGRWVAYTVTSIDSAKDKSDADLWMTSWDGTETVRLTWSPESEGSPRWSPDGKYLAFVSGRQEGKGGQLWLLDRRGGEAQRVTQVKGGVSGYAWAPDGKRIVVGLDEETDSVARRDTGEKKTPRPIVIDRYGFKRDVSGYLGSGRTHLGIFDLATRKLDTLTRGLDDDNAPAWSPDGQRIAFVRTGLVEPKAADRGDVYVVDAKPGAAPRKLTDYEGGDGGPLAWSPDGRTIAFLRGDLPKYSAYTQPRLGVVAADGSAPARLLAESLDRPIGDPVFSADGKSILVTVTDDRERHLARVRLADGAVERLTSGQRAIAGYSAPAGPAGQAEPRIAERIAVLASTPDRPNEVFALERGALRQLSHQNDSIMNVLQLGNTSGLTARSSDGNEVHAIVTRPAGVVGRALPMVLYIHGGPNGQDQYAFSFDRELFAASGYAVLAVNYRGSNGRGVEYQRAIFADWGHKEVLDLLGAVDEAVRQGIADSTKLVIGGWSYGGILTDYTIATTPRFKAAVSGAGSALQLSMYGSDQYIAQYEHELGQPWEKPDLWIKLSWPFFKADRIRTPAMFMVGEKDFNVPAIGSEQMYQALRALGVPTKLVIYPGQFHGITTPSYRVDRYDRWLGWYNQHLSK